MNARLGFVALAFLGMLIVGCGQGGGSGLTGVTGGGEDGYGGGIMHLQGGGDGGYASGLIGSWRHDWDSEYYTVFTFGSDGSFEEADYWYDYYNDQWDVDIEDGSYSVSEDQLTITVYGESSYTYTYSISGNELTLTFQGVSIVFYRVG